MSRFLWPFCHVRSPRYQFWAPRSSSLDVVKCYVEATSILVPGQRFRLRRVLSGLGKSHTGLRGSGALRGGRLRAISHGLAGWLRGGLVRLIHVNFSFSAARVSSSLSGYYQGAARVSVQGRSERFRARMTPSKATNAMALAGNARRKHGTNPLQ